MVYRTPAREDLLSLVPQIHEDFAPVWQGRSDGEKAALAGYFLPHRPRKFPLNPTRPKAIKWYCPFASQSQLPTGHRYCINVYVGCDHKCLYCYALGYGKSDATPKRDFCRLIDRDLSDMETFDVPPAPVHISNSTDPFQPLETQFRDTQYTLEQILAHRHRFTTVTILTKNPSLAVREGYVDLFRRLNRLPASHPRKEDFDRSGNPGFQVQVSLAFWRDGARETFDPGAPHVQDRIDGIRALREAGVPVVLRIDPLFPRSPLPTSPSSCLDRFGLEEPQTIGDLENLAGFAKEAGVRHVAYSSAKIVLSRHRKLAPAMQAMLSVYRSLSPSGKPVWRGGSWRLPNEVSNEHVTGPLLEICKRKGVEAKFCMRDLLDTP